MKWAGRCNPINQQYPAVYPECRLQRISTKGRAPVSFNPWACCWRPVPGMAFLPRMHQFASRSGKRRRAVYPDTGRCWAHRDWIRFLCCHCAVSSPNYCRGLLSSPVGGDRWPFLCRRWAGCRPLPGCGWNWSPRYCCWRRSQELQYCSGRGPQRPRPAVRNTRQLLVSFSFAFPG